MATRGRKPNHAKNRTKGEDDFAIGTICEILGASRHRVDYIIRNRGIAPKKIIGGVRVFSRRQVHQIAEELANSGRE